MTKFILKVVMVMMGISLFPLINRIAEYENAIPECCGGQVEFVGSHTSIFSEQLTYQCQTCKKIFALDNPHKRFKFSTLWRMIFMPDIKVKDERKVD